MKFVRLQISLRAEWEGDSYFEVAIESVNIATLRRWSVGRSLFAPLGLQEAIDRMGFVQADPIRAPARAQDLILRLRVAGYQAGDLERAYPDLEVEEGFLYAYGFLSHACWRLVRGRMQGRLNATEKRLLEVLSEMGEAHPKMLDEAFGGKRVINAWGGQSKETTQALERLHRRGFLRVARRSNGIRIYARSADVLDDTTDAQRLAGLVWAHLQVFAPCPLRSLLRELSVYRSLGDARALARSLVKAGSIRQEIVDGLEYVWPDGEEPRDDEREVATIVAPFDPVVWDRRRFEHLWGWAYRFEAYTPVAKRTRGYYAMPLIWESRAIGWVNARVVSGRADFDVGYVERRPSGRRFLGALDEELARMEWFLGL